MRKQKYIQSTKKQGPKVNQEISSPEIRLIDDSGAMQGVIDLQKALDMAKGVNLDLIEVSPNASPPVCKIMDYGKYKYQHQKKISEARKKQKTIEVKELKLRPTIEENDLNIKLKSCLKFLKEGNKVKFSMRFRGREMAHQDIGMNLMKRIITEVGDAAKIETSPRHEGRQMLMVITPPTV